MSGPNLPKAEGKRVSTSIRLPQGMMDELDALADETGHERSEVIIAFLRWALDEYAANQKEKKGKR